MAVKTRVFMKTLNTVTQFVEARVEDTPYLCSSLSICLAKEILLLIEAMKVTSTGKESRSLPATKRY